MPLPPLYRPTEAEQALMDAPDTMDAIVAHVAAGGTVEGICDTWNRGGDKKRGAGAVRFGIIWAWITQDEIRWKRWLETNNNLGRADEARIKNLCRAVAFSDVRCLLDEQGRILPVSEWPAEASFLVAGLDVDELFGKGDDKGVLEGLVKKVKMSDRHKYATLLAQLNGLLVEKREVSGKVTMETLVAGAKDEPKPGDS